MRHFGALLTLVFLVLLAAIAVAQQPVSYEAVTMDATAGGIGFTSTTLTVNGNQVKTCSGVLETAAVRFRYDGLAAVTAADGIPLAVGQVLRIDGYYALTQFRGIRTTGTSGVIRFTCSR